MERSGGSPRPHPGRRPGSAHRRRASVGLLTVIWPWWTWQQGGYFATVLPHGVGPLNGSPRAALRGLQVPASGQRKRRTRGVSYTTSRTATNRAKRPTVAPRTRVKDSSMRRYQRPYDRPGPGEAVDDADAGRLPRRSDPVRVVGLGGVMKVSVA